MAGKHAAQTSNNKGKVIAAVVIAALIIAGVAAFFVLKGCSSDSGKNETAATTSVVTTTAQSTTSQTPSTSAEQNASEKETAAQDTRASNQDDESSAQESGDIAIPTEADAEVSYFNATFIPNGEATDAETGESVSLREALGASYSEGVLTFNSDGTFTDSITPNSSSGKYVVQNNKITATYSDDRNMDITVTDWNDGAPSAFHINYGGCIVYFG